MFLESERRLWAVLITHSRSGISTQLGSRPPKATMPSVMTLFTSNELNATVAEDNFCPTMFSASRTALMTESVASFKFTITPLERPREGEHPTPITWTES